MVCSKSGKRPHLVKIGKGGRVSCDHDCPNWKSFAICSHCVAVAEAEKCLEEFANFYRKSKNLPSVTQLLLTGLPKGIGNKGNCVTRKRKRVDIDARVPLALPEGQIAGPSTSNTGHEEQVLTSSRYLPGAVAVQAHGIPSQLAG